VVDADEDDADNTGTLIVALMQKERRLQGLENFHIGYDIYTVSYRTVSYGSQSVADSLHRRRNSSRSFSLHPHISRRVQVARFLESAVHNQCGSSD